MARNLTIQILRGLQAHLPALSDGEFYLAEDTGYLFVGLGGINYNLGAKFMASVSVQGNANPTHFIEPNADGSIVVEAPGGAAVALDGTDATGVSGLTGSAGIRGWLSSLYAFFNNCAAVKGTPANLFLSVQQSKDLNRSKVILTLTKATSITAEALVTLTQKKGDATTTSATSYTVTAGKTLRIQSILLSATLTTAAITSVAARLREGAAGGGAVSVTSDIIAELETTAGMTTITIGQSDQTVMNFPDGLEVAGGQQIGFSELANLADAAVTIVLVGYEY